MYVLNGVVNSEVERDADVVGLARAAAKADFDGHGYASLGWLAVHLKDVWAVRTYMWRRALCRAARLGSVCRVWREAWVGIRNAWREASWRLGDLRATGGGVISGDAIGCLAARPTDRYTVDLCISRVPIYLKKCISHSAQIINGKWISGRDIWDTGLRTERGPIGDHTTNWHRSAVCTRDSDLADEKSWRDMMVNHKSATCGTTCDVVDDGSWGWRLPIRVFDHVNNGLVDVTVMPPRNRPLDASMIWDKEELAEVSARAAESLLRIVSEGRDVADKQMSVNEQVLVLFGILRAWIVGVKSDMKRTVRAVVGFKAVLDMICKEAIRRARIARVEGLEVWAWDKKGFSTGDLVQWPRFRGECANQSVYDTMVGLNLW